MNKALLVVLAVLLSPAVALAHGGVYRPPIGTPGPRIPSPKTPAPTPPEPPSTPTPPHPPSTPTPPDPGTGDPVPTPTPPTGIPGTPPAPTPRPRPAPATGGPGVASWIYWWTFNRERILKLRELQTERIRARTADRSPTFFGGSYDGNQKREIRKEAWDAILAALLDATHDENEDVSTGAILALGKAGDARAIPRLRELASNRKLPQTVRESAALAVGMVGERGPAVRAFLSEVATDPRRSTRTRAFAALGLGFTGDPGAVPTLVRLARDRAASRDIPACGLVGLGLLGDEIVVPDLAAFLGGRPRMRLRDDALRAYSAAALGMLRSRAAVPALRRALRDGDRHVRRQAALSLGALLVPEDRAEVKDLLAVAGGDRDSLVRAFAVVSLGEIGDPLAANALLYAYRKGDRVLVPYAAIALGLLGRNADPDLRERIVPIVRAQFAKEGNHEVRSALALALGILRDEPSVPVLVRIVGSRGDPMLRSHAATALGLIGSEDAIPILREALTERANPELQKEVALALGLLGDRKAESILTELVKVGTTEYVRGSAAVALGRLATPETALALRDLLADKGNQDTTRAFVAVALGLVMDRRKLPLLSRIGEHLNHTMAVEALAEVLTFL